MQLHCSRVVASAVGLVSMISLTILLLGHEPGSSRTTISLPQDWSHRHVIFSNPATLEQSVRVKQDARFWQQWYRRNVRQSLPADDSAFRDSREPDENPPWFDADWFGWFNWFHRRPRKPAPTPRNSLKRDWAISLGPNASVGAGDYPAKFSFDITTANCASAARPDFVVFNTGVATGTQATIVAYDNLYSGCSGGVGVPTTYWAYNTGGAVVTSVTLSLDGSQVAFVQTPTASTQASLVLLKWKPTADGASSTAPDSAPFVANSAYSTCTAPCMTTLAFSGGANDTLSSPFYDYFNDALYVGDNGGSLHKFQPVFTTGTPAEVGSPWPVLLGSGFNKLDSPVLDSVSGKVFVGTAYNGASGAQLFSVNSSTGAIVGTSSPLGIGNGLVDGPVVDSSAGQVYVFVGSDNSTGSAGSTCLGGSGHPCAAVYQFTTSFTSGTGIEAKVSDGGNGTGTFTMHIGAFDNAYYTSPTSTGSLYVCGNLTGIARLFRVSVSSGVMSTTSLAGPFLASIVSPGSLPCGPVTEVFNPSQNSGINSGGPAGTDKIFLSTTGPGTTNPCFNNGTGGCILDFPVTTWQPSTTYSVGQEILDTNLNIQVVVVGGKTGTTQPTWPSPGFGASIYTSDGSAQWVWKEGFGTLSGIAWAANSNNPQGWTILDSNQNLEVVTNSSGKTGTVQPSWATGVGVQTDDGTEVWVNVGPLDSFYMAVAGGTSGIIVDNTVPTATLPGGSQVYFAPLTLGFNTCGAGNGCAVQASQAGLK